jgi:hypothetical protein
VRDGVSALDRPPAPQLVFAQGDSGYAPLLPQRRSRECDQGRCGVTTIEGVRLSRTLWLALEFVERGAVGVT